MRNNLARAPAQEATAPSSITSFVATTRTAEIFSPALEARSPRLVLLARLRKRQLERIFIDRYGGRALPNDDAGRRDLRAMADHLALIGEGYVANWTSLWTRWLSTEGTDALVEQVGPGKYWMAADLGEEMNLDAATRLRLKAWHLSAVDATKEQLGESRKQRKAANRKAKRATLRAARPAPASRIKPWLALGMSRASWFRHGKPMPPGVRQNLTPISLDSIGANFCLTVCEGRNVPDRRADAPYRRGDLGARGPVPDETVLDVERIIALDRGGPSIESLCGCARENN
jgi:hypothetical protein